MKLASFEAEGAIHVGIVTADGLIDLARAAPDLPGDMIAIIAAWPQIGARLQEIADEIAEEPTEAEGAFALAAAVALADDEIDDAENEFINQLAEWFGISEDRANEILDQLDEDQDEDEDE